MAAGRHFRRLHSLLRYARPAPQLPNPETSPVSVKSFSAAASGPPWVPHSAQGDKDRAGRLLKQCFSAAFSHWVHRSPMASRK